MNPPPATRYVCSFSVNAFRAQTSWLRPPPESGVQAPVSTGAGPEGRPGALGRSRVRESSAYREQVVVLEDGSPHGVSVVPVAEFAGIVPFSIVGARNTVRGSTLGDSAGRREDEKQCSEQESGAD